MARNSLYKIISKGKLEDWELAERKILILSALRTLWYDREIKKLFSVHNAGIKMYNMIRRVMATWW